ncbi:hypothetical protein B0H13DRAFT_2012698, partial [Mycena leptocephala]
MFSTCVVTTIVCLTCPVQANIHISQVSLVHAAFILRNCGMKILILAIVEDCLSLIVANIPVVITTTIDIVG